MDLTPKVEVLITEGHFYRRSTQIVDLGSQDAMLATLVDQAPVMLPKFMPFGNGFMHLLITKTQIFMATELDSLPFSSWFEICLEDTTKIQPAFIQTSPTIKLTDPWKPSPTLGKIIFGVQFNRYAAVQPKASLCFLFQYLNKELFSLPYSNVYENGRICMGPIWDREVANRSPLDLMSQFIHAHTSFHTTEMNSHLTYESTFKFFRRNVTDGSWAPPKNQEKMLRKTANAFMMGWEI